jgi:UTP-glucose-1-phosphate uridylyltransferase
VLAYQDSTADHLMLSAEIPREMAPSYGVLKVDNRGNLEEILEKPPLDQVPTPSLINISKFIFSAKFLNHLDNYIAKQLREGQEYWLTDVVLEAVGSGEQIEVRPIHGQYLDVGNADAWLTANNVVAGMDFAMFTKT